MAEEPIIFPVSDDGGVQRLVEAFEALGIAGGQALDMLNGEFQQYEANTQKAAAITQLVETYFNSGGVAADKLGAALSNLSEFTLTAALANQQFITSLANAGVEQQAMALKVEQTEAAIEGFRQASIDAAYAEGQAQLAAAAQAMEALKTEEAAWSAHAAYVKNIAFSEALSVQAAYDSIAASCATVATAMQAAQARATASAQEAANLRVLAALEEEQGVSAYLKAEDAAWAEHAAYVKDIMMSEALSINASYDAIAASSAAAFAEINAAATTSLGNLKGLVTGFTGQIAAFATVAGGIHAINGIDQVNQQLRAVLPNAQAVDSVFSHLADTAIATQSPLEAVAKNFTALYSSMTQTGKSTQDVLTVTDSLTKLFYVTGASSAAAARSLHDFSEAMATGNLSGQQLLSFLRNTPQAASLLSQALGTNVQALTAHAQAIANAEAHVQKLQSAQNGTTESVAKASSAYKSNQDTIASLTQTIDDEQARLKLLQTTRGNHTIAIASEERAIKENQAALLQAQSATAGLSTNLAKATDAHKATAAAALGTAQAVLKAKEGLSAESIQAALTSEQFRANLDALAQTATGTVSGAFIALEDKIEVYLKYSGDAATATTALRAALTVLGDNLNIIIPSIVVFGATWAAVKLGEIAIDLANVAKAGALLVLELGPLELVLGAVAVAGIALALSTETGRAAVASIGPTLQNYIGQLTGTKAAQDALKASQDATNASTQPLVLSVTNLTNAQIQQLGSMRAVGASTADIVAKTKDFIAANQQTGDSAAAAAKQVTDQGTAVNNVGTATQSATQSIQQLTTTVDASTGQQSQQWTAVGQKISVDYVSAVKSANDNTNAMTVQTLGNLQQIIDKATEAANAMRNIGSGGGASPDASAAGASRNGSSFTVAGSSGVDSKLIAVSPGEHVTVQTPQQHYAGTVNNAKPAAKFRDGGTLNVPFDASTASVTGYSAVNDSDYYKSYTAPDVTASTTTTTIPTSTDDAAATASASTAVGGTASYVGSGTTGGGASTDDSSTTQQSHAAARRAALAADVQAIQDAGQVTAIDGVQKPTGGQFSAISVQQALKWIYVVGHGWEGRPGALGARTTAGDVQAAEAKYHQDLVKPVSAFRDGGSFTVAGSGGVDSQLVQMAVSPGEQVSVETPAQQRQRSAPVSSGRPNVTMIVQTKDANSFGQSQAQLAAAMRRKLARG